MKLLLEPFVFLLGVFFFKGFLEPLVVAISQRKVRKYAPQVLHLLDKKLPHALMRWDREEVQVFVEEALEALSGTPTTLKEAEQIFNKFDIRVAAEKLKV